MITPNTMKRCRIKNLVVSILLLLGGQVYSQDWYDMANSDNANYFEVAKAGETYFAETGTGAGSGYKLFLRWKYFAKRIMNENGDIPNRNQLINRKRKFEAEHFQNKRRATFSGNWEELGPFSWRATSSWNPGLGRITAIAVEPNNQQLIFAGSPGGGIWRTTNSGAKWEPLGDNLDEVNIFGIGIDPFNNNNVYHLNSAGRILKSTNQGNSWSEIYNTGNGVSNTRSIIFHPTQQGTFFVAAGNGIYKSTNNGGTFTKVHSISVEDLAFKPDDSNVIYACGNSFYKSTDGGNSFVDQSTGINSQQRLKMAVTPANPNYIYLVQKSGGEFGALYRSTNAGTSFNTRNATNPPYLTQASRDMAIMVSSTDAEEVHVAGMNNHRSNDGGNSFIQLAKWSEPATPAYIHADVEVMLCVNDHFYAGTDGGIFRSTDHGNTYEDLSSLGGLAVHQFYRIAGSQNDPSIMIGGAQDNGCNIMKNKEKEWIGWTGADGMEVAIDYTNSNVLYGSVQNGSFYVTNNGGLSYQNLNTPASGGGNWVTPFEMDPTVNSTIYVGYADLHRSEDQGLNWTNLTSSISIGGNLDEVTIAPSNSNYIYIARGQTLWRTKNGKTTNPTWVSVSSFSGYVNYITVDPNDPERVAIACSGSNVYESKNAGDTWENRKMNLPSTGALCVIYDNETSKGLYVGTENSVYYTNDLLTEWEPFGNGLPKVRVNELDINYAEKTIRVGTYGRGMWESGMAGSSIIPSIAAKGDFIFCEGEAVVLEAVTENLPAANYTYQWRKEGVDIAGETGKEFTASEDGKYTVRVDDGSAQGISGTFSVSVIELPKSDAHVITSCGPGDIKLEALNKDVEVSWFTSNNGTTPEFTGHEFVTNISTSTDYYLEAKTKVLKGQVGIPNNSTATGANHAGGFFLVFDVISPLKLKKAKVYAQGTKIRAIELRDINNILINTKDITIQDGESVIDIDFNIPAGNGYQIGFTAGADLFRSNVGVQFPYVIDGLISINSSTATTPYDFYYYLYNWEVEEMYPVCTGSRTKISAKVMDKPNAPTPMETIACVGESGPFKLKVDSTQTGLFRWYETNLGTTVIDTGYAIEVNATTDYFVENVTSEIIQTNIGPKDHTIGSSTNHAGNFYLLFNTSKTIKLEKGRVFAQGAKMRTLVLLDSAGNSLIEKEIFINDGDQVIDINITIPIGIGYQIGFKTGADLLRNNEGVTYPYEIKDVISIINSTADKNYFYYLYDWQISYDGIECTSEKSTIAVTIDLCTGSEENLAGSIKIYPNPSSGYINLEYSNNIIVSQIKIIDLTGRIVYMNNQPIRTLNLSDFATGEYTMLITDINDSVGVYRVIISK